MANTKALSFVAVGRISDTVPLAHFADAEVVAQSMDIFRKLLAKTPSKLRAGQRMRLQWGAGSVFCLLDQKAELLVCVVAARCSYPEWPAYQLLHDLLASVQQCADTLTVPEGALDETLRPVMQELVAKYSQTITTCALEVKEQTGHQSRENESATRKRRMINTLIAVAVPLVILVLFYVVFAPRSAPVEEADSSQATMHAASRHQAGLPAVRSMITLV